MAKSYNPKAVEASWYEWWEESGFFTADPHSTKPPLVMVVPPANVTGALPHAIGTGAVKVTAAHDPEDFKAGKRHNLEFIKKFTDDGLINR